VFKGGDVGAKGDGVYDPGSPGGSGGLESGRVAAKAWFDGALGTGPANAGAVSPFRSRLIGGEGEIGGGQGRIGVGPWERASLLQWLGSGRRLVGGDGATPKPSCGARRPNPPTSAGRFTEVSVRV